MSLTDRQIKALKPEARPYKAFDGNGLFIHVLTSGVRSWYYRYQIGGREKKIALGRYPETSLADAREQAAEMRRKVRTGTDPMQERKNVQIQAREREVFTFRNVAKEWQALNSAGRSAITLNVRQLDFDWMDKQGFGRLPISDITTPDVYELIRGIRERRGTHIAARIQSLVSRVMQFAVLRGILGHNPARELSGVFTLPPSENRRALPVDQIGTFFRELDGYDGSFEVTRAALHMLVLTFVRPGELCGAEWSEFDMKNRQWVIPAARMKKRREHLVPLSEQVMALLASLRATTGDTRWLFPTHSEAGHLMRNSLNNTMQRMRFRKIATPHGFRALASSTLNEKGFSPDVIERQLAHVERNRVRAAYNRAEYLEERTRMMQWWADFVDEQRRK